MCIGMKKGVYSGMKFLFEGCTGFVSHNCTNWIPCPCQIFGAYKIP